MVVATPASTPATNPTVSWYLMPVRLKDLDHATQRRLGLLAPAADEGVNDGRRAGTSAPSASDRRRLSYQCGSCGHVEAAYKAIERHADELHPGRAVRITEEGLIP